MVVNLTMLYAVLLRFAEVGIPADLTGRMMWLSPVTAMLFLVVGWRLGLYATIAKYASLRDIWRLALAIGATALLMVVGAEIARLLGAGASRPLPLSIPLIWGPVAFLALGASRVARRLMMHLGLAKRSSVEVDRILIVGAGDAGEHVVRDMMRNDSKLKPVGFLDDDPAKIGKLIHGLPVVGPIDSLGEAVAQTGADQVIIAIPDAPSTMVRSVVKLAEEAGTKSRILPTLTELMGHRPTSADIRDVDIGDIIGRRPIRIDHDQIASKFENRVVLVSGAAGSIGSELARQAMRFSPSRLVLLDNNETDLYLLCERLKPLSVSRHCLLSMEIADIRDSHRIDLILEDYRPNVVLHAAAYKHVGVMELHPSEAVKTNVLGTRNLAEAANKHGVERFVLVSTDKAVNPTSVMGATKRLSEMVLLNLSKQSLTAFASVRFGNVLGSRGSVVPILAEQIRNGGPMTVTHADATRYFMTIEEAASLILQAGAIAHGGETFVLEMGEPVRIMDLAERMRDLLASDGKDSVEIVLTGLRKGEKLNEDLWHNEEVLLGQVQPGILRARPAVLLYPGEEIVEAIDHLEEISTNRHTPAQVAEAVFQLVGRTGDGNSKLTVSTANNGWLRPLYPEIPF